MKKNLFLMVALATTLLQAQIAPSIQWQKSLGGTSDDQAYSIQQTTEGGYILAGSSISTDGNVTGSHGSFDFWVVKLDSGGNPLWQKSLGGTGYDEARSIQQTTDGGYIVAGSSGSSNGDVTENHGGTPDYWVVKLNSNGTIQWQKSLGGTNDDKAHSIQQTTDGGYIVAGYSASTDGDVTGHHGPAGFYDYWVVKLDSFGNLLWQKSLGGTLYENANSIKQTTDGGFIIAGSSYSTDGDVTGNHNNYDYWVVKLDASGNLLWQKSLGGSFDDYGSSIQQTTDGGFILAGYANSSDGNVTGHYDSYDYWVVKLDGNGNLQWQKSLGGNDEDRATSVQQTTDGGYIVAGYSKSTNGNVTGHHGTVNKYDSWMVKLDGIGNLLWQKSIGGTDDDLTYSIQLTKDGGYIIAGSSYSNDGDVTGHHGTANWYDCLVVKLAPDNLSVSDFNKKNTVLYPNPVKDILHFSREFSNATITDMSGKMVLKSISSQKIDVSALAKGVYIVNIQFADGTSSSEKVVKE